MLTFLIFLSLLTFLIFLYLLLQFVRMTCLLDDGGIVAGMWDYLAVVLKEGGEEGRGEEARPDLSREKFTHGVPVKNYLFLR